MLISNKAFENVTKMYPHFRSYRLVTLGQGIQLTTYVFPLQYLRHLYAVERLYIWRCWRYVLRSIYRRQCRLSTTTHDVGDLAPPRWLGRKWRNAHPMSTQVTVICVMVLCENRIWKHVFCIYTAFPGTLGTFSWKLFFGPIHVSIMYTFMSVCLWFLWIYLYIQKYLN